MSGVPDAAIAACPNYEAETCRAALRQVLAPFGGLAWVKPGTVSYTHLTLPTKRIV